MPSVFPAALASFHSLPQARSRAIMASRPGDPVFGGLVEAGAGVEAGADAVVGAGVVAAGPSAASPPHSALRNSFQVWPLRVPPSLAAWYLALHSFIESACAGSVVATPAAAASNIP